jgi:hypothetical protein
VRVRVGPLALIAAIAALCAVSSCATAPRSADESIAYGYGLYTGLENALAMAVENGSVSKGEARTVDEKAAQARALLEAARAAEALDPGSAATDLEKATAALTALQTWVNHPSGGPP